MRFDLFRGPTLGLLISSLCLNGTGVVAQQPEAAHYQSAFARPLPDRSWLCRSVSVSSKLHTRASLAMVVAHPDDEDGGMLTYEGRGQGVDTTLLTLNRGEGGQNDMTSDYWDQLGTLRTQELLAAGDYYGVHQYFTRVADFGFSKTIEEALKTWGHDRVLYDVVRVIRMQRPLVITSTFVGNVSDGHGHHQVSGAMAQEAYKAAGDPNVFPDQIKAGLLPWTPLKVYGRVPFARVTEKGVYDYATGHWEPAHFRNYTNDTWIEGVTQDHRRDPHRHLQPPPRLLLHADLPRGPQRAEVPERRHRHSPAAFRLQPLPPLRLTRLQPRRTNPASSTASTSLSPASPPTLLKPSKHPGAKS